MEILLGDERLPARFWAKVSENPETGCWEWTGSRVGGGYGGFYSARNISYQGNRAHRVAYAALVGPVDARLDLDHLCRVRHCVNPAHLEPVTRSENLKRGAGVPPLAAANAGKTHCPRGHEYDEANTQIRVTAKGHTARGCRACVRLRNNTPERKAYMREYHRARAEARAREAA